VAKPILVKSIAGFYVRVAKPGQYAIKTADARTVVKFSVEEEDFSRISLNSVYIPVANCPQWRLSSELTSEIRTNSPDLTIMKFSRLYD
jgi:hypothetical protein